LAAKDRHYVTDVRISRGRRIKHFRLLSNMFPNCNKTYPDCPEYPVDKNGDVHETCAKCPIYIESRK